MTYIELVAEKRKTETEITYSFSLTRKIVIVFEIRKRKMHFSI